MPQISYIKYTDILEARRYDAEYFKPEYLDIEKRLNKKGFNSLKSISSKIFRNPMMYGFLYIEKKYDGFPFIRIDDLNNPFIELEGCKHISKEINKKYNSSQLFYGDIVMGVRGNTIGRLGVYNGKDKEANISPNVIFFRLKDKNYSNFIALYLLSKYGKLQIERMLNGTGQPTITSILLNELKIPLLPQSFQSQIEQIVKSAHQKQTQSKQLYREAEELLLSELGLLDYEVKHSLWFTTTKNEIDEAHRYDSEYFQPKYVEIIEKTEEYEGGWDLVRNQFKQNTALSIKDGEYCSYIEISDVNTSNGEITPNKVEAKDIPANGKRKLFKNDLLISKVRPYRGAVSFVDFEVDNLIGSGAFTVLQEKTDYRKEVLMIFLKTQFIKDLLLRYNCGTSYPVIKDEDILNLKIPLIKPQIQKQIAEKIQESHRLRKESKELLEEAKRKVEAEIEK